MMMNMHNGPVLLWSPNHPPSVKGISGCVYCLLSFYCNINMTSEQWYFGVQYHLFHKRTLKNKKVHILQCKLNNLFYFIYVLTFGLSLQRNMKTDQFQCSSYCFRHCKNGSLANNIAHKFFTRHNVILILQKMRKNSIYCLTTYRYWKTLHPGNMHNEM